MRPFLRFHVILQVVDRLAAFLQLELFRVGSGLFTTQGAWEQQVIFQMDMFHQVSNEFVDPSIQRPPGDTCAFRRRHIIWSGV